MRLKDDKALMELAEKEKKNISTDGREFARFLAYTHDEGPDDVEPEPERRGIRKLKGTPVWTLLYPARQGYHAAKFLYQNGPGGVYQKAGHALRDNRFTRRKEARSFLTKIMPTEEEKERQREREFPQDLTISVLVPLYNTPERYLRDMIESVAGQTFGNWELCMADASDGEHGYVGELAGEYAAKDSRIHYQRLERNRGIAENTNACIAMSSGKYLALFDHDDVLHPCALYECARAIEEEGAEFVYTDEVTFEGEELENIVTYHFKPDFSVDNLRGVNYICHLSVFLRALTDRVGVFYSEYDGSQDHDMILRLTDVAAKVAHVPKVLYFWRYHQMSTSMNLDAKSYAVSAGRRAVQAAEERRGYPAEVHSAQICKTHYRMKYRIGNPRITVIIDGAGAKRDAAARTAAAVEVRTTYGNYEIRYAGNREELCREMKAAEGSYLLLLAAGAEPLTPSFMEELLMFAQRRDVGAVGMQVLDEKNLILSSDLVICGQGGRLALEVNRGERYDAPGYMGRNYYAHDISAVSACACMGRKEEFGRLWAEGEANTSLGRMLEVCMRLRGRDKQIVLNPYALCRMQGADYREELSAADRQMLMERFGEQIKAGDPFYNPNLSLERFWQKK